MDYAKEKVAEFHKEYPDKPHPDDKEKRKAPPKTRSRKK
jgi:hypothetical protein